MGFLWLLVVLLIGVVMLGCIGGQNFVYSKGKVIGPGSSWFTPLMAWKVVIRNDGRSPVMLDINIRSM